LKPAGTGQNMRGHFFTVTLTRDGTGLGKYKMKIIARVTAFEGRDGLFSFLSIACF